MSEVRPDWAPHGTLRFLELAAAGGKRHDGTSRIQSLKHIEIVRETVDEIDNLSAKIQLLKFNEVDI